MAAAKEGKATLGKRRQEEKDHKGATDIRIQFSAEIRKKRRPRTEAK